MMWCGRRPEMRTISKLSLLGVYTSALLLVTYLPYFVAHRVSVPGSTFNGYLVFDEDMNSYFSYIRQSADGSWLFHNLFTPENHTALLFNLEWLALGKISWLLHVPVSTAFQIERVLGGITLLLGFCLFASIFIEAASMRRFALLLFSLGGGFGWVFILLQKTGSLAIAPMDLLGGLHPFFQIMLNPHFSLAQGSLLLTFSSYLAGEIKGGGGYYLISGIACALVGLMRPYDMVVAVFTMCIFMALRYVAEKHWPLCKTLWRSFPILMALPVVLYYQYLFEWDPVYKWWHIQSVQPPVYPLTMVVSAGLGLFLALGNIGQLLRLRGAEARKTFLLAFLSAMSILTFSFPVLSRPWQFGTVWMGPLIIAGLMNPERSFLSALLKRRHLLVVLLIVNSLTSVWLVLWKVDEVSHGMYRTDNRLIGAFRWLEENSSPSDVVFASCETGNSIPRFSGNRVFCGYVSTVELKHKASLVERFFDSGTSDQDRRELLERYGIKYVFYGPRELTLGKYQPETSAFLRLAYRNEVVGIFVVEQG